MQTWTAVSNIEPSSSRAGQAGICQGPPFTMEQTAALEADCAAAVAAQARDLANSLKAAADVAARDADAAAAVAKAAARNATKASKEAYASSGLTAPMVRVKWDADGEIEAVPVAHLAMLG